MKILRCSSTQWWGNAMDIAGRSAVFVFCFFFNHEGRLRKKTQTNIPKKERLTMHSKTTRTKLANKKQNGARVFAEIHAVRRILGDV